MSIPNYTVSETGSLNWRDIFIYSFVHLLDVPVFTHLNNQTPVSKSDENNRIKFDKQYTGMINVLTSQCIDISDISIKWNIKCNNNHQLAFLYGLTIAIDSAPPLDLDSNQVSRVSHYSDIYSIRWPEQNVLNQPALIVTSHGQRYLIAGDYRQSTQFYYFEDKGQWYLKVSARSIAPELDMYIHILNTPENASDTYNNLFDIPANQQFSDICVNKILNYYGACVKYSAIDIDGILFHTPSQERLHAYLLLLWKEMLFYPRQLFSDLGVTCIHIAEHKPITHDFVIKVINGAYKNQMIFLNISVDVFSQRLALHHEVFHAIEHKLKIDADEDLAECYSYLIADPTYIYELANNNRIVSQKLSSVFNILRCYDPLLYGIVKNISNDSKSKPRADGLRSQVVRRSVEVSTKKDKFANIYFKKPSHSEISIVGMQGCGLSLAAQSFAMKYAQSPAPNSVLIFTPETTVNDAESDVIVLVRNPIDMAAREYFKSKTHPFSFYSDWMQIYEHFYNKHFIFIKYEDIVFGNNLKLNKILAFWNKKCLDTVKIDADRARYNLSSVPQIRQLILEFQKSRMCWYYGYESLGFGD